MKKIILSAIALVCVFALRAQTIVNTFDEALHQSAPTLSETFTFPDDVSGFSQVIMHFNLTCPAGGCDPWDRIAWIQVERNDENVEIGRYVTPYGNGNCGWELDVTEYKALLTGEVTLKSFIETYGNGWDLTVDFEFIEGVPEYAFHHIENLWVDYNFTYGDTLFFPINLLERFIDVPDNTQKTVLRVVNTGHGQGNTDNAAEFSQKTHRITVNGVEAATQYLWKSDCAQNPCGPQAGTWTLSRAGWCPGQEVQPDDYDISGLASPGSTVAIDYQLEPFFNLCSPFNVDLSTGASNCSASICTAGSGFNSDCNYNGNQHTSPNYKISVQVIHYSNTAFTVGVEQFEQAPEGFKMFPNPSRGTLNVAINDLNSGDKTLTIYNALGEVAVVKQFQSGTRQTTQLNVYELARGVYIVSLATRHKMYTQQLIIE